jgi:hypothetical protein
VGFGVVRPDLDSGLLLPAARAPLSRGDDGRGFERVAIGAEDLSEFDSIAECRLALRSSIQVGRAASGGGLGLNLGGGCLAGGVGGATKAETPGSRPALPSRSREEEAGSRGRTALAGSGARRRRAGPDPPPAPEGPPEPPEFSPWPTVDSGGAGGAGPADALPLPRSPARTRESPPEAAAPAPAPPRGGGPGSVAVPPAWAGAARPAGEAAEEFLATVTPRRGIGGAIAEAAGDEDLSSDGEDPG